MTTPATMARPSGASEAASLIEPALASNPVVRDAVSRILAELRSAQAKIVGARAPSAERRVTLDEWLHRTAEVKGRPAFYPYLGTGLGHGALVELADGSVKWDMIGGIGVHMFGHGDPEMVEAALIAALSDTVMQGHLQFNADSTAFAELLVSEASRSSAIKHCFVSNSGCMVNEAALKVCQQKTHAAPRVIAFADCFMGRSTTMAQIGDGPNYRQGVALNVQVDYMPFYDPDLGPRSTEIALWHLRQTLDRYPRQHSCFVMELIQGEGGFNVAPREFFVPLLDLCRERGIPIWFDEVQSFGRTTSMFAFQTLDLGSYADVVTIGKMSQACACLYTAEMNPKPGLLAGTFTAATSAFHVGLRVLQRLRDGGYYGPDGRIAKLHAAFRERAEALVAKHPEWFPPVRLAFGRTSSRVVGGIGGMMRLTPFGGDKDRINTLLKHLFEDGVITLGCGHGPYHLRFLPPIGVFRPEQFDPVFEILERSLARS
ncbi:MAG: aminotransferase class III-fold pyridoxal phosphate-dependent enzyme [Phycisphaeraceae bacterium]|nr:aminotransferase class III-fold pyridoxal phosphate-dependent enzyme [Phycisphaeraceae bacterium]